VYTKSQRTSPHHTLTRLHPLLLKPPRLPRRPVHTARPGHYLHIEDALSSDDGVGGGRDTGPQVGALLGYGAGDGRACVVGLGQRRAGRGLRWARTWGSAARWNRNRVAMPWPPGLLLLQPLSTIALCAASAACCPDGSAADCCCCCDTHAPFISPLGLTMTPALSSK